MAKKRKLSKADLKKLNQLDPSIPVFACRKVSDHSMGFFCPLCRHEHWHGWVKEPFVMSHRSAHCGGRHGYEVRDQDGNAGFTRGGYMVFWDGTEGPSLR
jgi:hypothetical protein